MAGISARRPPVRGMGQPVRLSSFCYGLITARRFSYLAPNSPELLRAVRLSRRLCLTLVDRGRPQTLQAPQRRDRGPVIKRWHDRHGPRVRCSGSGDAYEVAGLGSVSREEVAFFKLCYFLNRRLEFAFVQLRHCLTRNPYLPSSPARRAGFFALTRRAWEYYGH